MTPEKNSEKIFFRSVIDYIQKNENNIKRMEFKREMIDVTIEEDTWKRYKPSPKVMITIEIIGTIN